MDCPPVRTPAGVGVGGIDFHVLVPLLSEQRAYATLPAMCMLQALSDWRMYGCSYKHLLLLPKQLYVQLACANQEGRSPMP